MDLLIVGEYSLRNPGTNEDWQQYHAIRRRVLWERRGQYGVYDENHPDESNPGRYPLLLTYRNSPIGVIRVDIEETRAIFRRVAITEALQRVGHGRVLLALAEAFAKRNGCDHLYSFVTPDAVEFYQKCGFESDPDNPATASHVPMAKRLPPGSLSGECATAV